MLARSLIRILFAILLMGSATVRAEEQIWSALILASNPPSGQDPLPPPQDLAPHLPRLTKALRYEQFEILGSATKAMGNNQRERWLVPSPTFLLGAQARREGAGYRVQLEVFQEKRRLVQTEVRLNAMSPIFILGPRHERGQLIIVLEIRR